MLTYIKGDNTRVSFRSAVLKDVRYPIPWSLETCYHRLVPGSIRLGPFRRKMHFVVALAVHCDETCSKLHHLHFPAYAAINEQPELTLSIKGSLLNRCK